MTGTAGMASGYADWLERLTATYEAVSYTCRIRLGDRVAGEAVALRVAAGLIARPAVFRHWGLPYSGRIAKLAEDGIADVAGGHPVVGPGASWPQLRTALAELPAEEQETFVLTCVEGHSDERLAEHWACDADAARARRDAVLDHMRHLAADHR